MEKPYMKPTLEKIVWRLDDVILSSRPTPTEEYEVPIKRVMKDELGGTGALGPEETMPPDMP